MASLRRSDDVFVIDLAESESHINPDLLRSINELLDEVEQAPEPRALVTCGSGRLYSMGLDLGWMAAHPGGVPALVGAMHELFARMLELPVPTVAALNGHAFAGGAMFALSHDYRVMRADRSYFSLPEVDGEIAFSPGLSDLIAARMDPQVAHQAMTSGRRYAAGEALALRIVDRVAASDQVVSEAISVAAPLAGKDARTYGAIKARLHRRVIASLRDVDSNLVDASHFRRALAGVGGEQSA